MEREDPPLVKMTPKKSDSEQENPSEKPLLLRLALLYSLLSAPLGHVLLRSNSSWVYCVAHCFYSRCSELFLCFSTLAVGRFGFVLLMLVIVGSGVFLHADALLVARRCQRNPRKRYQRWWFYWIFFVCMNLLNWVCIVGVRTWVAETFSISANGMSPALQPGDRLFVDKLWFSPQSITRNALVVYRHSGRYYGPYIKRVIGLPGEVIEIKNEVIYINGEKWLDEYGDFTGKPKSAYP